jgi:plastocyanin
MEWGMNSVPARTETIQVTIGDLVFPPADIKAKAGGTVTWINKDIAAHMASVRGGFDVVIEANAAASLVLTKAGIVEYYCRFHPNMMGQITIAPEQGASEYFCFFIRSGDCWILGLIGDRRKASRSIPASGQVIALAA